MKESLSPQEIPFSKEASRINDYLSSIEDHFLFKIQTLGLKEDGTLEENSGFSYRKCDRACFILLQLLNKKFNIPIGNGLLDLYGGHFFADEIGRPFQSEGEAPERDHLEFVYAEMTHSKGLARAHASIIVHSGGGKYILDPVLGNVYKDELEQVGSDLAGKGIVFEKQPEGVNFNNWLRERFGTFLITGYDLAAEIAMAQASKVGEDDPHSVMINGVYDGVLSKDNQMLDILESFAKGEVPQIYQKEYLDKAVAKLVEANE